MTEPARRAPGRRRRTGLLLALTAGAVALGAVIWVVRGNADAGTGLESYTDPGDACPQAVSAIAYADDVLKPVGQEDYQVFDDAVRSRLSAVGGTLALEARDWPDAATARQAEVVQPLAERAGAREGGPARARVLLEYRVEAARLVLLCRDARP